MRDLDIIWYDGNRNVVEDFMPNPELKAETPDEIALEFKRVKIANGYSGTCDIMAVVDYNYLQTSLIDPGE